MNRLQEREAQVKATTEREREEVDTTNPIIFAETNPNRFQTLTFFFPEEDGVKIQEDLDLNIIEVFYFDDEQEIQLTKGSLYEWALDQYQND